MLLIDRGNSVAARKDQMSDVSGAANTEPIELNYFEPVDPWKSSELSQSKMKLPHLETSESAYFVTFHCRAGLFLSAPAKEVVLSAIRYWEGDRLELRAAEVMPDHVHLIFRVLNGTSLSKMLQSIKGYSARGINQLLRRKGPFWLDKSFDHVIRHRQELEEKIEYIRQNAVARGLVENWRDYPWLWIKE